MGIRIIIIVVVTTLSCVPHLSCANPKIPAAEELKDLVIPQFIPNQNSENQHVISSLKVEEKMPSMRNRLNYTARFKVESPIEIFKGKKFIWYPTKDGKFFRAFLQGGPQAKASDGSDAFVQVFTTYNQNAGAIYNLADLEGILNELDCNVPTVVVCHGFTGSALNGPCSQIKPALYRQGSRINVICADWSGLAAAPWYDTAAAGTKIIGELLARLICHLFTTRCLDLSQLTLIGHSLGAHVVGHAGKYTQQICNCLIQRIFATDPAGPLFTCSETQGRLWMTDAKYVHAIHTDCDKLGSPCICGHTDDWKNGGADQPCCPWYSNPSCDHQVSVDYLAESIDKQNIFYGCPCNGDFDCSTTPDIPLGYHCSDKLYGDFCGKTAPQSLYSNV